MQSVAIRDLAVHDVVMDSRNLPEAANVTGSKNKPVRGSRYAAGKKHNHNKSFKLQQRLLRSTYMNTSCNK